MCSPPVSAFNTRGGSFRTPTGFYHESDGGYSSTVAEVSGKGRCPLGCQARLGGGVLARKSTREISNPDGEPCTRYPGVRQVIHPDLPKSHHISPTVECGYSACNRHEPASISLAPIPRRVEHWQGCEPRCTIAGDPFTRRNSPLQSPRKLQHPHPCR